MVLQMRHILLPLIIMVSLTHSFRQQSVGVRGILKCGKQPLNETVVKLWDEDEGPDADDLLDEAFTDSKGFFQLSGHTRELTNIEPVLKIYHKCNDEHQPCQRKVRFRIPDKFINNGKTVKEWYNFGELNMEGTQKNEERSCV